MTASTPLWLDKAQALVGVHEVPGPKHSPVILRWLRNLNAWWADDETPWCGTFVAHCLQEAGQPVPKLWFRAKGWVDYGSLLRPDRLAPGAILVFERAGGGHVGFYVGEDAGHYFVLGGNQANGVNVMKLGKTRLIASRWPKDVPVVGKPVRMAGGAVSTNEA